MQQELSSMMRAQIEDRIRQSIEVKQKLLGSADVLALVALAAEQMVRCLRSGGKVLFFGNGGSAADAQHLAAEFTGRYLKERSALPAIALSANTSSITAIGNDYGFDLVFARQLEALGRPGDVAVGISTSGNSANVLRALELARARSMFTIALTGAAGSKMKEVAECAICVPSAETPRIQECHVLVGHILCEMVENAIVGWAPAVTADMLVAASAGTK